MTARWQMFRDLREPDDRPHHVANLILRACGVCQPPIPIEAIAHWLGLRVERRASPGWDGALDSTMEPPIVWINSDERQTRQRFAMAHQIGHALLHAPGVYRDATFSPGESREERDANDFAVALLAPLWMVEPLVMSTRLTTDRLAAMFNASPGALGVQLEKLL